MLENVYLLHASAYREKVRRGSIFQNFRSFPVRGQELKADRWLLLAIGLVGFYLTIIGYSII
jgi:hypothetical protein